MNHPARRPIWRLPLRRAAIMNMDVHCACSSCGMNEVTPARDLVKALGRSAVIGALWRHCPPAAAASAGPKPPCRSEAEMEVPARFKWFRSAEGFKAYPTSHEEQERFMAIRRYSSGVNSDRTPYISWESWLWQVCWEGWFSQHGFTESKQQAADHATEAWWRCIQTDIPRDVDMEVAMIAARVMIMPPPNSLFIEHAKFLHAVLWHLKRIYSAELKDETVPSRAKNLIEQPSAELFKRRQAGEDTGEAKPYVPSHPVRLRRR